jgi:hypothetical protein
MKRAVLLTGLAIIVVANVLMIYYAPYGISPMENFQNAMNTNTNVAANTNMNTNTNMNMNTNTNMNANATADPMKANAVEGFQLASAGGARDMYQPMGQFDGVKLSTGNSVSGWRYTAPNEPLTGPEFEPGDDSLFMFKNNQCKPECCGASFSCGGGCVCTTPQQRQYIAGRGGNRNAPEDSA